MHETDERPGFVIPGGDHSLRIEIDFREGRPFERVAAKSFSGSATELAIMPEFDQVRRVGIAKCPKRNHVA
jgi:hypothetical protein